MKKPLLRAMQKLLPVMGVVSLPAGATTVFDNGAVAAPAGPLVIGLVLIVFALIAYVDKTH